MDDLKGSMASSSTTIARVWMCRKKSMERTGIGGSRAQTIIKVGDGPLERRRRRGCLLEKPFRLSDGKV